MNDSKDDEYENAIKAADNAALDLLSNSTFITLNASYGAYLDSPYLMERLFQSLILRGQEELFILKSYRDHLVFATDYVVCAALNPSFYHVYLEHFAVIRYTFRLSTLNAIWTQYIKLCKYPLYVNIVAIINRLLCYWQDLLKSSPHKNAFDDSLMLAQRKISHFEQIKLKASVSQVVKPKDDATKPKDKGFKLSKNKITKYFGKTYANDENISQIGVGNIGAIDNARHFDNSLTGIISNLNSVDANLKSVTTLPKLKEDSQKADVDYDSLSVSPRKALQSSNGQNESTLVEKLPNIQKINFSAIANDVIDGSFSGQCSDWHSLNGINSVKEVDKSNADAATKSFQHISACVDEFRNICKSKSSDSGQLNDKTECHRNDNMAYKDGSQCVDKSANEANVSCKLADDMHATSHYPSDLSFDNCMETSQSLKRHSSNDSSKGTLRVKKMAVLLEAEHVQMRTPPARAASILEVNDVITLDDDPPTSRKSRLSVPPSSIGKPVKNAFALMMSKRTKKS